MKILGISAKKQGGKNTSLNYIFGQIMCDVGIFNHGDVWVDDKGRLVVPASSEDGTIQPAGFDPLSRNPLVRQFLAENLDHYVRAYSFADPLKRFCVDVMGLKEEQCYGTDEEKNSPTHLRWDDFANVLGTGFYYKKANPIGEPDSQDYMSGREVLQFFGTDIMREIYNDVWVDATIRKIKQEEPSMAIVCDVRFPNEVEGIQRAGGKVMRLTRAPFANEDQHESETALDEYEGFDAIVENSNVTIEQNNKLVRDQLFEWWGDIDV